MRAGSRQAPCWVYPGCTRLCLFGVARASALFFLFFFFFFPRHVGSGARHRLRRAVLVPASGGWAVTRSRVGARHGGRAGHGLLKGRLGAARLGLAWLARLGSHGSASGRRWLWGLRERRRCR